MTKSETAEQSFDLSQFDGLQQAQDEGTEVIIIHPVTGAPTTMKFWVAGPDSKRRQNMQRQLADVRLRRRKFKMSGEDLENESKAIIAACVIKWEGFVEKGQALECNVPNIIGVFQRYPFIFEQVDEIAGDRVSFLKK
jgi:hypothetical protein